LIFKVEFWIIIDDCYDNQAEEIEAESEVMAILKAKKSNPRGKNFKIL